MHIIKKSPQWANQVVEAAFTAVKRQPQKYHQEGTSFRSIREDAQALRLHIGTEQWRDVIMSCSRCNGCMVEDYLLDMEDSSGPMWLQAWRCMNCGNVFDSVLHNNRMLQGSTLIAHTCSSHAANGDTGQAAAKAITRLVA